MNERNGGTDKESQNATPEAEKIHSKDQTETGVLVLRPIKHGKGFIN